MKNTFGSSISVTLFGESHGKAVGVTLEGLPSGFEIDVEELHYGRNFGFIILDTGLEAGNRF